MPCACPSSLISHSRHHADSYARGCQPGLSCSCGPVCCPPHSPGPCLPPALPPGPELILHTSGWNSWDLNPGSPAHSPGGWDQFGARAEELGDGVGLGSPLTFNPRRPKLSLSHALLFGRASPQDPPLSPSTDTSSLKWVPDSPTWSSGILLRLLLPRGGWTRTPAVAIRLLPGDFGGTGGTWGCAGKPSALGWTLTCGL